MERSEVNEGVNELLERLLGLEGLRVSGASLEPRGLVVHVRLRHYSRRCGICNDFWSGYDTHPVRRWRHLTLERTPVWLSYAPRRTQCPEHGVRVERVTWAAHDTLFTTEVEQMAPWLWHRLGVTAACQMTGLSWPTLKRLILRPIVAMPDLKRIEERYIIGTDTLTLRQHSQDLAAVMDTLAPPPLPASAL